MASGVEKAFLTASGQKLMYKPEEKIGVVVVDNFPALGRLTALRFLEWVRENPTGVISLPTGKTPEHFIKQTTRYLAGWNDASVQRELEEYGIASRNKPDLSELHFVQIDEFYPINPRQHNSFYNYVNRFYIKGLGLDAKKALLINCAEIGLPPGMSLEEVWGQEPVDLSLRYRSPATRKEQLQQLLLSRIDQWCVGYEDHIRSLGGIGFFLGGIGPDGHIGFNVRGSDMHSTTRLTQINYETMAAAASDLGGVEVARRSLVITIGLSTITFNKNCVALIIAAGEAKAKIVGEAARNERGINFPATALQTLPEARFFITQGAAKYLENRQVALFLAGKEVAPQLVEQVVVALSLYHGKRVELLTEEDYRAIPLGKALLSRIKEPIELLNNRVVASLKSKIEAGVKIAREKTFLHTEPHHDDVMLGYLPYVVRHIREHTTHHHFVTFTSGFTAVTNSYMLKLCKRMKSALASDHFLFSLHLSRGYFDPRSERYRNRDVWKYLDGVASMSREVQEEGVLRRFLRNLIEIFEDSDLENLKDRVDELINYFETQYPGKKDLPYIQRLKGMVREWESACLWGYFGWHSNSIHNLRLGFYKGDIFTEEPTLNRDVIPVLELLKAVQPDIISVALDPEASGPDTHYKVMQAVSEALRMHQTEKEIRVIGYRNVWYRFQPHEANVFIPVSLNMLTLQNESFMHTYITQKTASFPSYEYDGPFPLLAQKIQVEQYEMLKTCLGRDFFYDHPSALLRATRGFVFLKSMDLEEFFSHSRELRRRAENR